MLACTPCLQLSSSVRLKLKIKLANLIFPLKSGSHSCVERFEHQLPAIVLLGLLYFYYSWSVEKVP